MKASRLRVFLTFLAAIAIPACCEDETIYVAAGQAIGSGGGGQGGGFVPPNVPDVLFLADRNISGSPELFATNVAGTTIVNLSGSLVAGGRVQDFLWSPDRSRVAFRATKDSTTRSDLYVVSAVGGNPMRVSDGVAGVADYQWAPNGSRIAFNDGTLHTSLPDGGGFVEVAPQTPSWFTWAPDSSRLAFQATVAGNFRCFTTLPNTSAGLVEITAAFGTGGGILSGSFEWAPNSTRIGIRGRATGTDPWGLYTATPDGSDLDLVSGGAGFVAVFAWAPDSSAVAYAADQEEPGVVELYTSPPATAVGNVRVSADLTGTLSVLYTSFRWAPDSSRIAYIADQEVDNVLELFTATPDGTDNDKVSGTLVAAGAVVAFEWAPNSAQIVYRADQDVDEVIELYSCYPTSGGPNTQLSDTLVAGGGVLRFAISPMSDAVVYLADQETDDEFQLYRANLGSMPIPYRISGVLTPGGDVHIIPPFAWTDDGLTVVYVADQTTDGTAEVYAAGAGGGGDVTISGLPLLSQQIGGLSVR